MPHITLKTGFTGPDGREEILSEYLCDWPDCANVAVLVVGGSRELRQICAVCEDHALQLGARRPRRKDSADE